MRNTQRSFQCISCRFKSHDPEQIYNLNMVTYGTTFASFLTVAQLAFKCERRSPNIARVTLKFGLDDLLMTQLTRRNLLQGMFSLSWENVLYSRFGAYFFHGF